MTRSFILAIALAASAAMAQDVPKPDFEMDIKEGVVTSFVDLRNPQALAALKKSNPAHYEKIRLILDGLLEKPERAEGEWLQTEFDVHDVYLSRFVIKTSNPPKQELQFTLDQVRYTMHLVRRDMSPSFLRGH